MEIISLLKDASIAWAAALVANGSSTDDNSSRFNMGRYQNVMFITTIDDCASGGVATLKVEKNSADSDTGMTAITSATCSATSAVNDDLNNKLLIVDVHNVRGPYVQAVRTSATANIAFGPVIAIFYNGSVSPVTQGSTVAASAFALGT